MYHFSTEYNCTVYDHKAPDYLCINGFNTLDGMDRWVANWMPELMDRMDGLMDGWMDGWMGEWMEWMNG